MAAILQTTFEYASLWMRSFVFWFEFHWSLFLMVQLTIFHQWFRKWLGDNQAVSHYLNQCWPSSLTHICATRWRWVAHKPPFYLFADDIFKAIFFNENCCILVQISLQFISRGPTDGTMMTSSNGTIFRVTGPLCGEFTGPRWIPRTKASDAELWCFLWSASEWTVE